MRKFGLKGTFNINSGLFDPNGRWRMSLEESKELYLSNGMEVAVHGYKHIHLTDVNSASATSEVLKDREELEKHFGGIIKGMAYAYNDYNDNVVQILKDCVIKYSRTVISTEDFFIPTDFLRMPTTCHHNNPKLFQLVEDFFAKEDVNYYNSTPRLFYLWGIRLNLIETIIGTLLKNLLKKLVIVTTFGTQQTLKFTTTLTRTIC